MAPGSPTLFERLSPKRNGSPILPLHRKQDKSTRSLYDLDELDPRPMDGLLSAQPPPASPGPMSSHDVSQAAAPRSPDRGRRAKVAFAGVPASVVNASVPDKVGSRTSSPVEQTGPSRHFAPQNVASSLLNIGSVFFDQRQRPQKEPRYKPNPDSVWRNIRRREVALEEELQQMLDMQSMGLAGGLGDNSGASVSDQDAFSDTGSSTPTGTMYYSSRSQMSRSLLQPTESTADGDVIPVRQPRRSKPLGIRSARRGLLRVIIALSDLKAEEDARVNSAISARKTALSKLRKTSGRQHKIASELKFLEENEAEPLGRELRQLEATRESLTDEIKDYEERLVKLRNQRRVVDGRIHEVRSRREAGLSGYRGAQKEVEAEVDALLRRPPIKPLDREFYQGLAADLHQDDDDVEPEGEVFMTLVPNRRTLEMAKSWWEAEIKVLERRREEVDKNREALEKGEDMWREAMNLVTDYETGLLNLMKGGPVPLADVKGKARDKTGNDANDAARQLLSTMATVIGDLERKLEDAEANSWNLLICAVGAELEAFREAERVLRVGLGEDEHNAGSTSPTTPLAAASTIPLAKGSAETLTTTTTSPSPATTERENSGTSIESPVFKAASPFVNDEFNTPSEPQPAGILSEDTAINDMPPLERSDSENSVPSEFLPKDQDSVD